jgi:hypothetical protein
MVLNIDIALRFKLHIKPRNITFSYMRNNEDD